VRWDRGAVARLSRRHGSAPAWMWLWCRSCGTKATSISFPRAHKHVTRRTYQETFDRAAAEAGLSPELLALEDSQLRCPGQRQQVRCLLNEIVQFCPGWVCLWRQRPPLAVLGRAPDRRYARRLNQRSLRCSLNVVGGKARFSDSAEWRTTGWRHVNDEDVDPGEVTVLPGGRGVLDSVSVGVAPSA
jgi:hypothetical protein